MVAVSLARTWPGTDPAIGGCFTIGPWLGGR